MPPESGCEKLDEVDLGHDLDRLTSLEQLASLPSLGRELFARPQLIGVLVADDEDVRVLGHPGRGPTADPSRV